MTLRLSTMVTLVGLLLFGGPTGYFAASAQELTFEQVGDQPNSPEDIEFDQEGTLWGVSSGYDLWRLVDNQHWEQVGTSSGDYLLLLSPDTLFIAHNSGTSRSTDAGQTFFGVHDEGGALFSADLEGPNEGLILTGTFGGGSGIAYSTDRGASFTEATFTVSTGSRPFMNTAVEITDGPAEGRLVAGVFAGVVVSEDGGQTWEPSSMFQNARFWVHRVEIGTDPVTGNRRLYATVADAQFPDVQFYYSDDDGLTWTNVPGMVDAFLFVFVPGVTGALLAVERGTALEGDSIEVWRSVDGGGRGRKQDAFPPSQMTI